MPSVEIKDLIGARFKSHGRTVAAGYDCYGLAIEISKRFGHSLPDLWYSKASPEIFSEKAEDVIARLAGVVEETTVKNSGDLIVFFDCNGNMVHIGVMLDEYSFIHADTGGVKVTRLDNYYRKKWKVYKWLQ